MACEYLTNSEKHAPGPWSCDPSDTKHDFPARQEVFGGGYLLAEVAGNGKGSSGANARLITAAPDLLAALERLLSVYVEAVQPTCVFGEAATVEAEAKVAIRKARGN